MANIPHVSVVGAKIGLAPHEAQYICALVPLSDGSGWRAAFGMDTPPDVKIQVPRLGRDLVALVPA